MIKLKDLLLENNLKERVYFRDNKSLRRAFTYAVRYKKEDAFYGELLRISKKSKFWPDASNSQILLHAKINFAKSFVEAQKNMSPKYKQGREIFYAFWNNYKSWPMYVKNFVNAMEMFK